MENQLKHLNRTMDEQISSTSVFTSKDEQNILLAIRNTSPKKIKRKNTFVPRLLTAALFAGVIFTSYTMIDNYLTPETANEIKKPEVRYAQELTQASSALTFDVSTRELTIRGTVKNTTAFNSEPFQAKVNILNEDVAAALGTKSLNLDVPSNNILKSGEPYSFEKVVTVELGIVDENTFKDALEVEIYSDTKTLTSFVIDDVTFHTEVTEKPVTTEDKPSTEQQNDQPTNSETSMGEEAKDEETAKEDTQTSNEQQEAPIENVNISIHQGKYYINGVTADMTLDETINVLGPYDQKYISKEELDAQNTYSWKTSINNQPPYEFLSINFSNQNQSFHLGFNVLKDNIDELVKELGEPFYINTTTGTQYFYSKNSNQLIEISKRENDLYMVLLRKEDDPSYIKSY